MAKFTDRYIDSLQPRSARYDVREGQGEGFAIRVSPNGHKSWTFIYKQGGQKKRVSLGVYPGMSLQKARSKFRELRNLLDQGIDPIEHERELAAQKEAARQEAERAARAPAVSDLASEYIEKWARPRKRSWEEDRRILGKDVLPQWGKRKARAITRQDVASLLDGIVDRGAGIQANRTLAVVRKMFNFAVARGIVDMSPCMGVSAPAPENRRDRVLTADEIRTLWSGLDTANMAEGTKLALKLQLVTAQRIGEIVNATWGQFDLGNSWWTIPAERAKNKLAHRVPLSPLALDLLEQLRVLSGSTLWLFPSPRGDKPMTETAMGHAVRRNLEDFRINPFTPHDLRRTAASHMTSLGISRLVVSKILNHVETGITAVYDRHSYDNEKRHALDAWGRALEGIVQKAATAPNVVAIRRP